MGNNLMPSRFNVHTYTDSGELLVYNSYTGAILSFSDGEQPEVLAALKDGIVAQGSSVTAHLLASGILVPAHVDEFMRAKLLYQSSHRTDLMHLIVMPTEACNFGCTYCYQTFPRGKMTPQTIAGLKQFVDHKARFLQSASISWFGGEPLLAPEIIEQLSDSFLQSFARYDVDYSADIATNGYYLTKEMLTKLVKWKITRYMVTLDGPAIVHDRKRGLRGGGGTFERIFVNLKNARLLDEQFEIYIRVNFDEETLSDVPELVHMLKEHFAGDERFQLLFRPVGRWGGPHDDQLPICSDRTANLKIWEFAQLGLDHDMPMASIVENSMMPGGSVCYAAKPYSLVVGANGQLYKCTCAFEEEDNHVGRLHDDGRVDLDYDKFAKWVSSGDDTDPVCGACYYRPACQGNHCPLFRMRTGNRPCSFEKRKIRTALETVWQDATRVRR